MLAQDYSENPIELHRVRTYIQTVDPTKVVDRLNVTPEPLKNSRGDLPQCIRLTMIGKIVSAHCDTCGAFVAASDSVQKLKLAVSMHPCVKEGC